MADSNYAGAQQPSPPAINKNGEFDPNWVPLSIPGGEKKEYWGADAPGPNPHLDTSGRGTNTSSPSGGF